MSSSAASSSEPVPGLSSGLPSLTAASPPWPAATPQPPLSAPTPVASEVLPVMTTRWSRPPSCTWTYVANSQLRPAHSQSVEAWLDLKPVPGASTLSCYPDGMFAGGRTGIFSPATCPSGWTTVSIRIDTEKASAGPVTTTAVCCSHHYTLDGSRCKKSVPEVPAVPMTYNETAGTYQVLSSSTTTLFGATIAVHPIRALFVERDLSLLGWTDEGKIVEYDLHEKSLPHGTLIGAATGVAVFALITVGLVVFCLLRWRGSQKRQAKGLGPHELDSLRRVRLRSHNAMPTNGDDDEPEPPPAYEAPKPADSNLEEGSTRQTEIASLEARRNAIQLRIEELQRLRGSETQATLG